MLLRRPRFVNSHKDAVPEISIDESRICKHLPNYIWMALKGISVWDCCENVLLYTILNDYFIDTVSVQMSKERSRHQWCCELIQLKIANDLPLNKKHHEKSEYILATLRLNFIKIKI